MEENFATYESIKRWKEEQMKHHIGSNKQLNQFHDFIMKKVFSLAVKQLKIAGFPCQYAWFLTGSGGRMEQSLFSDQDHGMIFLSPAGETDDFFLELGKELSHGLDIAGYPFCDGNIMSSNPIWCRSLDSWKQQLLDWVKEASWESIRYLLIFFDARVLMGNELLLKEIKNVLFQYYQKTPFLYQRIIENIMHRKEAIGPFGQLIVEQKGKHKGSIDLKYAAFLPYVNSIRVLAFIYGIEETSTEDRLEQLANLGQFQEILKGYPEHFQSLLKYRLSLHKTIQSYDDGHFLNIQKLSKDEKLHIKTILKDGKKLHNYVRNLV
ncbi:hypothetical protein J9303_04745 [Bacillaceae bacterium Marseille-Q3522]|nr:hypothetical protein [Bacillaceae bacterium Marseille-Q3522]